MQYNQNMRKIKITKYHLKSPKCGGKGRNLRFVFISDLHNVTFGSENCELLELVRQQSPDAVLIGGDQIVAKPEEPLEPGLSAVKKLAEEYPVYYACGNHEYRLKLYPEVYGDAYERFREILAGTKAVYLENETAAFWKNGLQVLIYGFEMKREYYERFSRRQLPVTELTDVFGTPPKEAFSILLVHCPAIITAVWSALETEGWSALIFVCFRKIAMAAVKKTGITASSARAAGSIRFRCGSITRGNWWFWRSMVPEKESKKTWKRGPAWEFLLNFRCLKVRWIFCCT